MPAVPATSTAIELSAETLLRLERGAELAGLSVEDFAAAILARVTVTHETADAEDGAAQNSETPPAA